MDLIDDFLAHLSVDRDVVKFTFAGYFVIWRIVSRVKSHLVVVHDHELALEPLCDFFIRFAFAIRELLRIALLEKECERASTRRIIVALNLNRVHVEALKFLMEPFQIRHVVAMRQVPRARIGGYTIVYVELCLVAGALRQEFEIDADFILLEPPSLM